MAKIEFEVYSLNDTYKHESITYLVTVNEPITAQEIDKAFDVFADEQGIEFKGLFSNRVIDIIKPFSETTIDDGFLKFIVVRNF